MFNIASIKSVTSHQHSDQWVVRFESFSPQRILYHPQTRQYVQQYIFIHSNPLPNQMQYYEYRKQQNYNLVGVNFADIKDNLYKVWVEYIPCRLGNIQKIDIMTSFIILLNASKGFKHILELHGQVKIVEDMIGINRYGFVKVWLSKYFHYNQPHFQQIQVGLEIQSGTSQSRMVYQLIKLIGDHLEKQQQKQLLRIISFSATFQKLKQSINNYLTNTATLLPEKLVLKELDVNQQVKAFIFCLEDVTEIDLKSIQQSNSPPNPFRLVRKVQSINISDPTQKRKRLSSIDIPQDDVKITKSIYLTPTAGARQNKNFARFQNNKQKHQKRSSTDFIQSKFQKNVCKIEFDENKQKMFKSSFKRKMQQINLKRDSSKKMIFQRFDKTPVKETLIKNKQVNQINPEDKTQKRPLKLSFSQQFIPPLNIQKSQTSRQIQNICFTSRSKKSDSKIKQKHNRNSITREVNSTTTRVQSLGFPSNESNINSSKHIHDMLDIPNQIQSQFNQFLKTSKSRSQLNTSKKKNTLPLLQFSKNKPLKQKRSIPSSYDKRFQYSTFYQQVNARNNRSREFHTRNSPQYGQKISSHILIRNISSKQNPILTNSSQCHLTKK